MWTREKGFLNQEEITAHRAHVKQLNDDASRALRLYQIDMAASRRGEREYPHVKEYTCYVEVNERKCIAATDYAKSRFHELPKKPARRKRNVSPAAKARHIARDRARRAAMA